MSSDHSGIGLPSLYASAASWMRVPRSAALSRCWYGADLSQRTAASHDEHQLSGVHLPPVSHSLVMASSVLRLATATSATLRMPHGSRAGLGSPPPMMVV